MNIRHSTLLAFTSAALAACGGPADSSSIKAASERHVGVDEQGAPCSLELVQSGSEGIVSLVLSGTFAVDYHVPTPGSGLYGVYRWDGVLSSDANMAESGPSATRSLLRDADVVKGRGKPVFWDTPLHAHKLVVKPNLAAPRSVDYSARQSIAGVVPFVDVTLSCRLGRAGGGSESER